MGTAEDSYSKLQDPGLQDLSAEHQRSEGGEEDLSCPGCQESTALTEGTGSLKIAQVRHSFCSAGLRTITANFKMVAFFSGDQVRKMVTQDEQMTVEEKENEEATTLENKMRICLD